jgi:adenosylhomocysteine nucleosidase
MGPASALAVAEAAFSELALDAAVSTGFAGALGAAKLGELIVGTDVRDRTPGRAQQVFRADPALLAHARRAAGDVGAAMSEGPVVTVAHVACRAVDKRALAEASGAIAVDMESAAIAQAAAKAGVPFLVIRAVSDRADEDLPMDFNLWLTPWGRMRGIAHVLTHPTIVRSLLRMKRQAEQGARSLARFFRAWLRAQENAQCSAGADVAAAAGVR